MFINKLNDCEKQILMDLFTHVARCDNEFPDEESNYILGVRDKYGLKMKFTPTDTVHELCLKITEVQSRIIILQELIHAAKIDGEFHPCEEAIINEVTESFDINPEKFTQIDEWVEEGMKWAAKGNDMISRLDVV